jgi:hypothetical protein
MLTLRLNRSRFTAMKKLEDIGGEPLEGSGFENEPSNTDYAAGPLDTAERAPPQAPQKP